MATSSAVTVVPAKAMTWSRAVSASRMLPSAARATRAMASGDAPMPSACTIFVNWSAMALLEIVLNSKTWDRERIVSGILSGDVVAITKATCGGGSSIDLSSALNDGPDSWWTSSMMKTL